MIILMYLQNGAYLLVHLCIVIHMMDGLFFPSSPICRHISGSHRPWTPELPPPPLSPDRHQRPATSRRPGISICFTSL